VSVEGHREGNDEETETRGECSHARSEETVGTSVRYGPRIFSGTAYAVPLRVVRLWTGAPSVGAPPVTAVPRLGLAVAPVVP